MLLELWQQVMQSCDGAGLLNPAGRARRLRPFGTAPDG
jgi:hypothetical protein